MSEPWRYTEIAHFVVWYSLAVSVIKIRGVSKSSAKIILKITAAKLHDFQKK
jgi:hypothetical protein